MTAWDDYDLAHGLRDKMAALVAEIVSGLEEAIAEHEDYRIADRLRAEIEKHMAEED